MQYVFKEPKDPSFEKVGVVGRIFPSTSASSKVEFFTVTTEIGHETAIIEHGCDFCYYVLEGSGVFLINDLEHCCEKGDLLVIPQGTKFTYKGTLRMFVASVPPWSEEQEETVE
jgi:mannose-6-phosphate isomerase-like protein (cupin superfamily)